MALHNISPQNKSAHASAPSALLRAAMLTHNRETIARFASRSRRASGTPARALRRSGRRGFSLVEIIITMAITVFLIAIGTFLSFDMYKSYLFRSESSTLVSALQRARSRAMANYFESPWAVCYTAPNYTLVQGSSCSTGTVIDTIEGNAVVVVSGFPAGGVVFSQLSGASAATAITLADGVRSSTVNINEQGTIIW